MSVEVKCSMEMNVYELKNAADKIEGYLIPRPTDKDGEAFQRAKGECLTHLQRQIDCVKALTRDRFRAAFRREPTAA